MMSRHRLILVTLALALTVAAAPRLPRLFLTSDRCVACHNGIVTPSAEDVSIGTAWGTTMMANSARDPYWQASIRRETLEHPPAGAAIENECAACHMPMARFEAKARGMEGRVFAHLPVYRKASEQDALAADGVSCSMCHQIRSDNLGTRESFTAGFVVDVTSPSGKRSVFGPFDVDEGRASVMRSSAGFRPEKADHIRSSELCASCHTLYTHALNDKSETIGTLPEQVPYLEWKHSAYADAQPCQSCHMPAVDGETPMTGILGKPREGFSRHVFVGGNFLIPRLFGLHRDALGVNAPSQDLEKSSLRTVGHLETEAAEISFPKAEIVDGLLSVDVSVANRAGHKLPTAYPSRRAWIHFAVRDGSGNLVFESGRLNADGSIEGNDNDADGTRFEPHHAEISRSEDVQIYEGILAGPDGRVTTVLLTASHYVKDNRLLPNGFEKATAEADIVPKGGAAGDADFVGGGDRIRFLVKTDEAAGPFEIRAELVYQPISYRWAHNLELKPSAEADRFLSYYKAAPLRSAVLSQARTVVGQGPGV
jgi:cytochrome c551/c552